MRKQRSAGTLPHTSQTQKPERSSLVLNNHIVDNTSAYTSNKVTTKNTLLMGSDSELLPQSGDNTEQEIKSDQDDCSPPVVLTKDIELKTDAPFYTVHLN